ncbi:[LysW]-lysine hydrolase [Halomarina rubra]|uniref:Putative [LysW]-lysine/[LysW]-ornithine hydrolase n=1 Tax=Halomarina rubra TaxID=2071873 RepID=A0ABD6AVD7_9EURY|nr:[LysW]-lysine hydrolase [Halomarina rubra]
MNASSECATSAPVSDEEARDLLQSMVATPSVSSEERAACELLVAFFEEHGREAWLDEVGNVRAPADDSLLLTSHVDTVPGEIPVRIEAGEDGPELWGRGSVDATGPLVAMAVAAVNTGVSFVGVVGEETDSRGARHLVTDREAPDALVNGEPSGWDGITLGYRGLVAGRYVATSESGHTSRPENNAIQDALQWWSRVESAFAPDAEEEWSPVFERVTPKPTTVEGGTTEDGLAVEATMDVQFRVPPSLTTEDVRELAERELNGGTVHWNDAIPPVMTSPRTEVARAFRVAIREADGDPRLLRKTGTADVNLYAEAWDCPMATYGPGDSALDHAPDERLSLTEFDRSVAVLESVARTL